MEHKIKIYVNHIRKLLGTISAMLFPARNSFDFKKIGPGELFKSLLKSKNLSGAAALTESQKISAVLSYKDRTTRSLVWNIKFKRDQYALSCAGYMLYHALTEIIAEPSIIIPMPISPARRRERGYNQCELLAKAILHYDTSGIFKIRTDILFKIKNVKKQTFKNRQERLAGVEGAFRAIVPTDHKQEELKSASIFLLDDVITTGSTMQAALDCLHQAGFKNVQAISLAH